MNEIRTWIKYSTNARYNGESSAVEAIDLLAMADEKVDGRRTTRTGKSAVEAYIATLS